MCALSVQNAVCTWSVGRSVDARGPVDHNSVGLAQAFLVRKHLSELLACNYNLHFPALFGE